MQMRIYIGFDDTDHVNSDRGTGKLARWFAESLPEPCRLWGIVRQQLLVRDDIPYTSHNSSACLVVTVSENGDLEQLVEQLKERAIHHINTHFIEGSDPGLCIAWENGSSPHQLTDFAFRCTREKVTQREAMQAVSRYHLSGHGGSNDGIIGAAAAVGLTLHGWNGRFIEFGTLRRLPSHLSVSELTAQAMMPISLDRNTQVPQPDDLIHTHGWLRPRLWGGRAVVPLLPTGPGTWESLGDKRKHKKESTAPGNNGKSRNSAEHRCGVVS